MSKEQGQLPAEKKDSSKLYRLIPPKGGLGAVCLVTQISYEAALELQKDDTHREYALLSVDVAINKVYQLEMKLGSHASSFGAKNE